MDSGEHILKRYEFMHPLPNMKSLLKKLSTLLRTSMVAVMNMNLLYSNTIMKSSSGFWRPLSFQQLRYAAVGLERTSFVQAVGMLRTVLLVVDPYGIRQTYGTLKKFDVVLDYIETQIKVLSSNHWRFVSLPTSVPRCRLNARHDHHF